MGERDRRISLLARLFQHAVATARYAVYYGEDRDAYDRRGRIAHESIFNPNDGSYRCPNSQQGYSPFSTWTRGLAWAILGYAEQLEFLDQLSKKQIETGLEEAFPPAANPSDRWHPVRVPDLLAVFQNAATAAADHYLAACCTDGIPVWDTGAPRLHRMGTYATRRSDPFNGWEPVDSSAAAIAAQGLLRLGNYQGRRGRKSDARRYRQAAFTIARTLFEEPYLSTRERHQGLILHSVYHRPNGWDHIPRGQKIPNGESSMWGDYHARELGLLILGEATEAPYLTFYAGVLPPAT
jgi:unsaturated chondroitin disaccharide hydrolase